MKKELSVIIPTLQKNTQFSLLLDNLHHDKSVKEIIVIDNSLNGFSFNSDKLKIISVTENIFVNPAWNLGIKHSSTDYWCLMNDDIMICEDFCSSVLNLMSPDMGIVGVMGDFVKSVNTDSYDKKILKSETMFLKKISQMCYWFGIAMFGHKSAYVPIPTDLKIFFGDNYLIHANAVRRRNNYAICGQEMYHLGSLSSKEVSMIAEQERPLYEKYREKYIHKMKIKSAMISFRK